MQKNTSFCIDSLASLEILAPQLLSLAGEERFWVIEGEMGVGKTTLTQYLCKSLGVVENVSSPTFSIVNEYQGSKNLIYHFDFYRLQSEHEAFDLGYEEYFYSDAYCFVEWASKIPNLLPARYIKILISLNPNNSRQIQFFHYQ